VAIANYICTFDSRSWLGVLDTTSCDVYQ